MTRLLLVLFLLGAGLVGLHGPSVTHAQGNTDAVHACQNGGYTSLQGTDGTTFKNEGQCIGYAARGGVIGGVSTCTVTPTTGCLTFNGVTIRSWWGSGNTITLTGATSFVDTCTTGECDQTTFPNNLATGGGTYNETDSSGQVISSGFYRIANTPGSQEGLYEQDYINDSLQASTCAAASSLRDVIVQATLINSTGATGNMTISAEIAPLYGLDGPLGQVVVPGDFFAGPLPSDPITC